MNAVAVVAINIMVFLCTSTSVLGLSESHTDNRLMRRVSDHDSARTSLDAGGSDKKEDDADDDEPVRGPEICNKDFFTFTHEVFGTTERTEPLQCQDVRAATKLVEDAFTCKEYAKLQNPNVAEEDMGIVTFSPKKGDEDMQSHGVMQNVRMLYPKGCFKLTKLGFDAAEDDNGAAKVIATGTGFDDSEKDKRLTKKMTRKLKKALQVCQTKGMDECYGFNDLEQTVVMPNEKGSQPSPARVGTESLEFWTAGTGEQVCSHPRYLEGTAKVGEEVDCGGHADYKALMDEDGCRAASKCLGYARRDRFVVDIENAGKFNNHPLGCFHTKLDVETKQRVKAFNSDTMEYNMRRKGDTKTFPAGNKDGVLVGIPVCKAVDSVGTVLVKENTGKSAEEKKDSAEGKKKDSAEKDSAEEKKKDSAEEKKKEKDSGEKEKKDSAEKKKKKK